MHLKEYAEKAHGFHSLGRFSRMIPQDMDSVLLALLELNHALMGCTLECAEMEQGITFVNLVEEAGDFCWFWCLGARAMDLPDDSYALVQSDRVMDALDPFCEGARPTWFPTAPEHMALDAIRRCIYYREGWHIARAKLWDSWPAIFANAWTAFQMKASEFVTTEKAAAHFSHPQRMINLILPVNFAKLSARHGGTEFNARKVLDRNLDNEAAIMEGWLKQKD